MRPSGLVSVPQTLDGEDAPVVIWYELKPTAEEKKWMAKHRQCYDSRGRPRKAFMKYGQDPEAREESMRLVQFEERDHTRRVGIVLNNEDHSLRLLNGANTTYELATKATRLGLDLKSLVRNSLGDETVDYDKIIAENRLLTPLDHPDPAHCLVSGTGLDHLDSALARDAMHATPDKVERKLTDSIRMYRIGLKGGKPEKGRIGAQPEWFYKGDGSCIVPPGHPLELPSYAGDAGEEAELVGLYIISDSGAVFRVGYALGNECSDHVLEKENYLYLAHSKLRDCSIGPELLLDSLPERITGLVRVIRNDETIWSSHFLTGEANMTHSIANIEYHHFKYKRFRHQGDVHCHFLGASAFSFSAGVLAKVGDVFEISAPEFGRPLRNALEKGKEQTPEIDIKSL